jgi:hypothetical protein
MFLIDDGKGRGYKAEVKKDNMLAVLATNRSESAKESLEGNAFMISTGSIALTTTASFNGIFYIKNNSTYDMQFASLGVASTVSNISEIKSVINPTGGTLISNAVEANQSCANFGLVRTFPGLVYSGADSYTVTGGAEFGHSAFGQGFSSEAAKSFTLAQGSSFAILVKPSASTNVFFNCVVYYRIEV